MTDHLYLDMSDLVLIKRDDRGEQWIHRSLFGPEPPRTLSWYPEGSPDKRVVLNPLT